MNSLQGQHSPDPTGFTSFTDNNELTTLTCEFSTHKGDGEQWTALITYPNQSGSKYQVHCQKHAAYTENMASPCCCAVKMHSFGTNTPHQHFYRPNGIEEHS